MKINASWNAERQKRLMYTMIEVSYQGVPTIQLSLCISTAMPTSAKETFILSNITPINKKHNSSLLLNLYFIIHHY